MPVSHWQKLFLAIWHVFTKKCKCSVLVTPILIWWSTITKAISLQKRKQSQTTSFLHCLKNRIVKQRNAVSTRWSIRWTRIRNWIQYSVKHLVRSCSVKTWVMHCQVRSAWLIVLRLLLVPQKTTQRTLRRCLKSTLKAIVLATSSCHFLKTFHDWALRCQIHGNKSKITSTPVTGISWKHLVYCQLIPTALTWRRSLTFTQVVSVQCHRLLVRLLLLLQESFLMQGLLHLSIQWHGFVVRVNNAWVTIPHLWLNNQLFE